MKETTNVENSVNMLSSSYSAGYPERQQLVWRIDETQNRKKEQKKNMKEQREGRRATISSRLTALSTEVISRIIITLLSIS